MIDMMTQRVVLLGAELRKQVRCWLRDLGWGKWVPFKAWHVIMCFLGAEFNCSVDCAELKPLDVNDFEKSVPCLDSPPPGPCWV